jgi:hypothetical protein
VVLVGPPRAGKLFKLGHLEETKVVTRFFPLAQLQSDLVKVDQSIIGGSTGVSVEDLLAVRILMCFHSALPIVSKQISGSVGLFTN